MNGRRKPKILLIGDATVDLYFMEDAPVAPTDRSGQPNMDWRNHRQWRVWHKMGGILLAREFMLGAQFEVVCYAPDRLEGTGTAQLASFARLGFVKRDKKTEPWKEAKGNPSTDEQFCRVMRLDGYSPLDKQSAVNMIGKENWNDCLKSRSAFNAVVVTDAGAGLRMQANFANTVLPKKIELAGAPVLIKMHLPLAEGPVWKWFKVLKHPNRTLVISAADLRASGVRLSHCLSWDQAADDLRQAATYRGGTLKNILDSGATVVVLFDAEGAAVLRNAYTSRRPFLDMRLVFDTQLAEGELNEEHDGDLVGKMSIFMTQLVRGLLNSDRTPPLNLMISHVRSALGAVRAFANSAMIARRLQSVDRQSGELSLEYPAYPTRDEIEENAATYAAPAANLGTNEKSLLIACLPKTDYRTLARDIIRKGPSILSGYPTGRFGKLITIDRTEIEGYRAIKQLFARYLEAPDDNKPMSVAVFGPPGSGKSFGVKQLVPESLIVKEFNLSQAEPSDLPGYFHEIRDVSLSGKTPLCFFDEFDSGQNKFLAHFLSPMQDGKFRDGPRIHPIGRAIFVFAGGVAEKWDEFQNGHDTDRTRAGTGRTRGRLSGKRNIVGVDLKRQVGTDREKDAKEKKVPDFASRLRGHIDITGLGKDKAEIYMLRRAILMRVLLEDLMPGIFQKVDDKKLGHASIDDDIIDILVMRAEYEHGARSLEQVLRMSRQGADMRKFSVADLPPGPQLAMHIKSF